LGAAAATIPPWWRVRQPKKQPTPPAEAHERPSGVVQRAEEQDDPGECHVAHLGDQQASGAQWNFCGERTSGGSPMRPRAFQGSGGRWPGQDTAPERRDVRQLQPIAGPAG
jgi:hypothetical protein